MEAGQLGVGAGSGECGKEEWKSGKVEKWSGGSGVARIYEWGGIAALK